jgi:hypothetical protein
METEELEEQQPQSEKIAIYSKWAILGFSVFFSPFVGSILLMINLRRTGNKMAGYLVLLFGIVYIIAAEIVLVKAAGLDITSITPEKLLANHQILYYSKALDILGAAILSEYFFRRYFKDDNYTSRSIFPPLLIVFAVVFLLGSVR